MKPYVLYTTSDKKYGDYLIDHWLGSLRAHTDLSQIDVRVLDFGLSTAQRYYLEHQGLGLRRCPREGHVAVVRFREMALDLEALAYRQVMACDGGDILFQADIAELFQKNEEDFRAVAEDLKSGFDVFLTEEFFTRETIRKVRESTAFKPQINAGVLLAPRQKFLRLCRMIDDLVIHKGKFGPDQLVVNHCLHTEGYTDLGRGYNYVVATASQETEIRNGVFYFAGTDQPIPIVHNAGNWKFLRPVEDFGFGPGHNRLKPDVMATLKLLHQSTSFIHSSQEQIGALASQALAKTRELRRRMRLLRRRRGRR